MIKWILLISQLFNLKKDFTKTKSALEYFEESVVKARGFFVFGVWLFVASLFLLIAIVVFIIGIGLQLEKSGAIQYSGLMVSASIFVGISIIIYLFSYLSLLNQRQKQIEIARLKELERNAKSPVVSLVEEILKQVLANVSQPAPPNSATGSADNTNAAKGL